MTKEEALQFLYLASSEPLGLLLSTNDPKRLREKLWQARKWSQDPSLEGLEIRLSPFSDNGVVVIQKRPKMQKLREGEAGGAPQS